MFDMSKDTYTCDFCEFEMQWDGHDEVHGEVWGCEKCMRSGFLLKMLHRPLWLCVLHGNDAGL